jgi:zinc transporter
MALDTFVAVQLDGNGGGKRIEMAEAEKLLRERSGMVWLRFNALKEEVEDWLNHSERFDSVVVEHLSYDESRPRSLLFEDGLLLSLRAVNHNESKDPEDMIAIKMWVEEKVILTSRDQSIKSFNDIEKSLEAGKGPRTASQFLSSLVNYLADNTELTMDDLEDSLEALEEEIEPDDIMETRSQLTDLRRFALRLKRYLTPQREALNHLVSAPPKWLKRRDKTLITENIDQYNRFLDDLLFSSERVRMVQEDLQNLDADQLNGRMYTLTIAATIFLPLSFFTGLFGINVGGIPFARSEMGFLAFCIFLVGFVVVQLLIFKRMKLL